MDIKEMFKNCNTPIQFSTKYFLIKKKIYIEKDKIIRCIEKMDWLGALYTTILYESDFANVYINDFWKRNNKIIIKKIQVNNEDTFQYMQMLYLCLMYIEDGDTICNEIFSENIYRSMVPVNIEKEDKRGVTIHYARLFVKAIREFDIKIPWKKSYCRIAMYIYHARENDELFLNCIETYLRKEKFGYYIDNEDAKKYFFILCNNKDFEAASHFLNNFDGSKGFFEMEPKTFINKIYKMSSPALFAFAKWYEEISYNKKINYDEWYDKVVELNHNEDCLRWIKITRLFGHLKNYAAEDNWELFKKELYNVASCTMFNLNEINYIKQIIKAFAYIVNKMILSNNYYLIEFIKQIEVININSFENIKYTRTWNLLEDVTNYNYNEILNKLFEQYNSEEATYIYMNSHLKNIISIEDFVKKSFETAGDEIGSIFENYPLAGYIILGNKLSAIRGKFFIVPLGIASNVSYTGYMQTIKTYSYFSEETNNYVKNMITSNEEWYSHNKEIAQLIEAKDICTFCINGYDEKNGILAVNFKLREDIQNQRLEYRNNVFPNRVIEWLSKIEKTKKYIEWDQKDNVFGIQFIEDMELRSNIALQILITIISLKDNVKELENLLISITQFPCEEINEFRYIARQRKLSFKLEENLFSYCRKETINMGRIILSDDKISCELKRDIFLNTCLRKFLSLEEAYDYIGKKLFENSVKPLILSLKLFDIKDNSRIFLTKQSDNTFYSNKSFIYFGNKKTLKQECIYSAILKSYDKENDCFIIKNVDLENYEFEFWQNYLKILYDIKKINFDQPIEIKTIKDRIKKYKDIEISSKEHIRQYTHEFSLIMQRINFSIKKAHKIIEILEETNPYKNMTQNFSVLVPEFKEDYLTSYYKFIENYKNNETDVYMFCDVFFKSYLRIIINADAFINDVNNEKYKKNNIIEYCCSKNYINKMIV